MATVKVRKCQAGDFEAIYVLLHQLWPGREFHRETLLKIFSQGLKSDLEDYYCAEENGRVIGYCSVRFRASFWVEGCLGYIGELIVDQAHRKAGIGKDLLKAVIARARERGCKRVELDSAFSRLEAAEFYLKMGFEKRANLFSRVV